MARLDVSPLELSAFGHKAWSRVLPGKARDALSPGIARNSVFVHNARADLDCRPSQLCERSRVPKMSSPTAETAAPAPNVKVEDSIVADSGPPDATERAAPAASPEAGLTKKEFDMMTSILHRVSNYRDEEYVL